MKRIFILLSIAALVSCNNQQETEQQTDKSQDEIASKALEQESVMEVKPGTTVLEPEKADPEKDVIIKREDTKATEGEIAIMFRRGTAAFENGEYERGIELFNQILEEDPEEGRAYYNLGVGYFKIDNYGEAIKAFTSAIKISPRDSLSIQYRGRVYYMMGDFKSSLSDYDRVVQLKPEDPVAYYNRGTAKGRVSDYLGAIADFDKAIELDPEYAEAYYNRGLANLYRGYLHEACYDWRKALNLGHYGAEKALKEYCEGGGK